MRLFDVAGLFFVATWVIALGAFFVVGLDDRSRTLSLTDGIIDLQEETLWMTASRQGDEVGILREDRTRLIDGWLIEIQGIVELEFMNDTYSFRFTSRSTLNTDLTLRSAIADVQAFGMHLKLQGHYRDDHRQPGFYLTLRLDNSSRQFVVDLEERPRLAAQAIPQMLASDDLQEGDLFRHQFFDPLTLSPAEIELLYEGREEIVNAYFSEAVMAHSFGQSVGNFHTRIHTDDQGTVIRQVLPMQVAMTRLPDVLGQSAMANFQDRFEDLADKQPPFLSALDAEDLLALVSRFGTGNTRRFREVQADEPLVIDDAPSSPSPRREFRILNLQSSGPLDLQSPRQHIAFQTDREARVETDVDNHLWHAGLAPLNSTFQPTSAQGDHPMVDALAADLQALHDDGPWNAQALSTLAAQTCPDSPPGDWAPTDPWPQPLPTAIASSLDCLALFADALSAIDRPPHFVHGALAIDGQFLPHSWLAIYHDGQYLGEVDPLLGGRAVADDHIQLYLSHHYRPDRLPELLPHLVPH